MVALMRWGVGGAGGVGAVGQGVEGVQSAAQRQRCEEAVLAGVRALVHDLSSPVVVLRARGRGWCVAGSCERLPTWVLFRVRGLCSQSRSGAGAGGVRLVAGGA